MLPDQSVFGLIDLRREERRPADVRVNRLHEPAMGLPNFRLPGPGLKPQDLVGLLIGHRARARRAMLPKCRIKLQVFTPAGRPAIQISF